MRIPAKELSTARAVCTATELALIESSHGPSLEKADTTRLKKKITVARELRDKWRDLFERQRREVQQAQGSRVNEKNQRSEEKSELFAKALARFEEQLVKREAAPASASAKKSSSRSTPVKAQRVRAHRADRSRTKEELNELVVPKAMTKSAVKPVPVAPAKKAAARVKVAAPAKAAAPAKVAVPAKAAAKIAAPAKAAAAAKTRLPMKKVVKKSAAESRSVAAKTKLPKSSLAATATAKSAAKTTRLKVSGKDSRVQGHVSAAGKRSQARRDGKK